MQLGMPFYQKGRGNYCFQNVKYEMPITLAGKNIMVLRPVKQSEQLCKLVIDHGGFITLFPTIEIKPLENIALENLGNLIEWSNMIVVISRNAAQILSALMRNLNEQVKTKTVFATGSGTADEMGMCGIESVLFPKSQSGSEGLLQMIDLHAPEITGKNILIFRGDTGRELLKQVLEERGASVKYAEIYTRAIPDVTKKQVDSIWETNPPDIIVFTSNQGLYNLIKMTPHKYHNKLFSTPFISMSHRIAKTARDEGFMKKSVIAETQTDFGLLEAINKNLEL